MNGAHRNISKIINLQMLGWILVAPQIVLAANTEDQPSKDKLPDPLNLLKTVAQARNRIASGEIEFEVTRNDFGHPLEGTNHTRLKIVFDGEKRRFESFSREYRSVLMGLDAGEATDAKLRELKLVKGEAAVQAGLFRAVDSHRVTAYDGAVVLDLSDISATEKHFFQTQIEDPAKSGAASQLFDPRIIGLNPSPSVKYTIESCLAYEHAESVELSGKETVAGVAAWHVRVLFPAKYHAEYDFWIDVNHPSHLVKCEWNGNTVFSKFDAAHPEDPIPIEVRAVKFHGKERGRFEEFFLRGVSRYNVPVDPASWTLAGLNMPVGTLVVDHRISRDLGYWNGTGLSKNLPPQTTKEIMQPQKPPNPDKLLALAEKDPKSPFALATATWILLNTPDGPAVQKAADIIRREHLHNTNLVQLCEGLERLRHRGAIGLLRSILENNPDANVQARACFTLATLLKGEANEAGDNQAAVEAARFFERVVADYGKEESGGPKLAERAKAELFELRRLGVGKVAPEIEGEDLNGRKMKLSNYRGKVVVLNFWGVWCGSCMAMVPDERKLVEHMAGKPFALIGVNSDSDLAKVKTVMAKEKITWPSFRDGGPFGSIATTWNVESWPTIFVLDRKGVIRYRDVRGKDLSDAVEKLIHEAK